MQQNRLPQRLHHPYSAAPTGAADGLTPRVLLLATVTGATALLAASEQLRNLDDSLARAWVGG